MREIGTMVASWRVLGWIGLIALLLAGPGTGAWPQGRAAFAQEQGQVPGGGGGHAPGPPVLGAVPPRPRENTAQTRVSRARR